MLNFLPNILRSLIIVVFIGITKSLFFKESEEMKLTSLIIMNFAESDSFLLINEFILVSTVFSESLITT